MSTNERPIDLVHLNSYTGGSRALNEEVLRLFETHCREMLEKLEEAAAQAAGGKAWLEAAHTLKGSSRGIGAFDLANAAAEAEKAPASDKAATLAVLEQLRIKSAAVLLFIEGFLRCAS